MRKSIIFLCVLFLTGCDEDPNQITVQKKIEAQPTNWKVVSQGYFKAGYSDNVREILIITSTDGKKYLAITGCGVTEMVANGDTKVEE